MVPKAQLTRSTLTSDPVDKRALGKNPDRHNTPHVADPKAFLCGRVQQVGLNLQS